MTTTALVVDDDRELCALVRHTLTSPFLDVVEAHNGIDALRLLTTQTIHIVILDINLPDISGFDVCQSIRQHSDVPILMLTGRAQEHDVIRGFTTGANDYVTKPFSPGVLNARTMNLLRNSPPEPQGHAGDDGILIFETIVLDLESRCAWIEEREVHFTRIEFDILTLLMLRPNKAYSRYEIINDVWRDQDFGDDHVLETHMSRLRKKILENGGPRLITSLRGVGYRLRVDSVPLAVTRS